MKMRKWFYLCAAVGVLTAAGAFSAMYYAWRHPDSYLGRCLSAAAQGGMLVNSLSALGASDDVATAASGDPDRFIPDDPMPVVEIEPLPLLVSRVVEVVEAPPPQIASSTPIAIEPDDLGQPAPGNLADLLRQSDESGPPAATEEAAHRPMIMPYAEDGDSPLMPMPFAEAEEPVRQKAEDPWPEFLKFWQDFFSKPEGSPEHSARPESDDLSKCQEDAHYHQQYSGCPYTGCPATGSHTRDQMPIVPRHTEPTPGTGVEEESEMPLRRVTPRLQKKLRELIPGDIDCEPGVVPRHPDIDTMEFRRTDRTLRELAPGGPY
jgi:hypothetical protein